MRRLAIAVVLASNLVVTAPRSAAARQATIELRHTPMLVRPNDTPSLCPLLALSLTEHLWVGGGYELVQDYDAILWTAENVGRKPVVMSGIRAGAWYRGGASRDGMSLGAGALFTYANPAISLARSPNGIDNGTSVFDLGADFSVGYVWKAFRLEAFATPAWSIGQVSSPAVHKEERYSAFTYRFGVALAVVLGQGSLD